MTVEGILAVRRRAPEIDVSGREKRCADAAAEPECGPERLRLRTKSCADGRFESRFALRLASQVADEQPVSSVSPVYDAFLLEHVLTALESDQRVVFVFRRTHGDHGALRTEFRVFGHAKATTARLAEASVLGFGDTLRRLLAARADCRFEAVEPQEGDFPHAYRVDVEGVLIADQAKPSGLGKRGVPVVLPAVSLVEARVSFWDALLSCSFPVEVMVTLDPVQLRPAELDALARALDAIEGHATRCEGLPDRQWLNKGQVRLLTPYFEREVGRWLSLATGVRAEVMIRTGESMNPGSLRWLAQTLLPTRRLDVVERDVEPVMCHGAVDLRLCINEAKAMPPLLPDREAILRLGLPLGFPRPSATLAESGIVLGKAWGSDVRLSPADRERHCYVIGGTGCGKSALLRTMFLQDVENGEGGLLIDPHGDLYRDVRDAIPRHRAEDVILVDPTDFERAPGLNYLEVPGAHASIERSFVCNELMRIFDRLYDLKQTGGPMFEQYMRNGLLVLMESRVEGATLLDVSAVFEDEEFRHAALAKCTSPAVVRFWRKQAQPAGGEARLENMVPYITSKLNQFADNALVRNIVGQSRSTVDFRKAMDERKIVLVNLSKGMLGEFDSSFLGMLVVAKLFAAALGRARMAPEARCPFNVFIDEFQNFTTDTIAHLLSEARKFGIRMTLSNQTLRQIDVGRGAGHLGAAVLGNVGTILAMRVGGEDVDTLRSALGGRIDPRTLQTLPDFHVAARLLQNGRPQPPFVFETLPPMMVPRDTKTSEIIMRLNRERYTRPVAEVEREIAERQSRWMDGPDE